MIVCAARPSRASVHILYDILVCPRPSAFDMRTFALVVPDSTSDDLWSAQRGKSSHFGGLGTPGVQPGGIAEIFAGHI